MRTRSYGLTTAQALAWRGTIHAVKRTRATAKWLDALDRASLASPPADMAIVLTGQRRKDLLDIGAADLAIEGKKRFVVVFLHDWPTGSFDDVYRLLSKRMKRLFPASAKRDTFTAFLAKVALHEAGHARQLLRNPDAGDERAEAAAEVHAWRELERLLPAETVFRTLAVFITAAMET